jgi:hypothetical protein
MQEKGLPQAWVFQKRSLNQWTLTVNFQTTTQMTEKEFHSFSEAMTYVLPNFTYTVQQVFSICWWNSETAAELELTLPLFIPTKMLMRLAWSCLRYGKFLLLRADINRSTGHPVINNSILIHALDLTQHSEKLLWAPASLWQKKFSNIIFADTFVPSCLKNLPRGSLTRS